ncbi:hypothetical protein ABT272_36660 [Streptomyces sp900105245]|uniref:Uncharacterized protein n=1 Tax=Streptomyces sp. 900105245 TaxID=3154379 RepID=A0ABV1UHM9_9ACTN
MTPPSTTTVTDSGEEEDTVAAHFYTYEDTSTSSRSRDFEESVMKACCSARQAQRARTHDRIAMVPRSVITLTGFLMSVGITVLAVFTMGTSSAIALQVGGVMAAAYGLVNDVRVSVTDDSDWRARHRIAAVFLRRHPLDRN